jgi:hypothetical protein
MYRDEMHFLRKWRKAVVHYGTDWGVEFVAVEGLTLCLVVYQSRRDDPMSAQGGANVSGANVAQPWDVKVVRRETPKGWP